MTHSDVTFPINSKLLRESNSGEGAEVVAARVDRIVEARATFNRYEVWKVVDYFRSGNVFENAFPKEAAIEFHASAKRYVDLGTMVESVLYDHQGREVGRWN